MHPCQGFYNIKSKGLPLDTGKLIKFVNHNRCHRIGWQQYKPANLCNYITYKSVIGLYLGTSNFITPQASKYATAQKPNIMA